MMADKIQHVPDESYVFEPPIRLHHLTGGLAALVSANRLTTILSPGGPGMLFFSLMPKVFFPQTLKSHPGIRFLGGTQFNDAEEMRDPIASNFIIAANGVNGQSLADAQYYHWCGVAVALHQLGRDAEAMMASRLNNQIRLCKDRLERLSLAYRTTLSIVGIKYDSSSTIAFTGDKYAHYIGSEYRSLLNELYSLRDAVLVVAYRIKYGCVDSYGISKIRQCVLNEAAGSGKLIAESLFAADPGLIERMSLYRSVAQHCLGANNPVLSDVYKIACSLGQYGSLPYLVFPLYDDIKTMRAIEQGSSKGMLEKASKEESIRFMSLPSHQDALEFSYDCFVKLLQICESLADEIKIEPKVTTITDDDIIEATFTDESGKVTRVKRDEKTGQLVKY